MGTSADITAPAGPRVERAVGVTDGAGNVTLTWPPGAFSAPPVVTLAAQAGGGWRLLRITANSASQTVVRAEGAAVVELLGLQVLSVGGAAAGVTVHAIATEG